VAEIGLRILPGGLVLLRGNVFSTNTDYLLNRKGELANVFAVPANLRPSYNVALPAVTAKVADESAVTCIVTIRSNGDVLVSQFNGEAVSFDGVQYQRDLQ
jgi:hypothetical protein